MNRKALNIVIAGFSYQEMIPLVQTIAQTAAEYGIPCSGVDFSTGTMGMLLGRHYLRLGEEALGCYIPRGEGDLLLGLEVGTAARCAAEVIGSHGTAIINTFQYRPPYIPPPLTRYPTVAELLELLQKLVARVIPIDALALAEKVGERRVAQGAMEWVMLGALSGTRLLPFPPEGVAKTMEWMLPEMEKEPYLRAFQQGVDAVAGSRAS